MGCEVCTTGLPYSLLECRSGRCSLFPPGRFPVLIVVCCCTKPNSVRNHHLDGADSALVNTPIWFRLLKTVIIIHVIWWCHLSSSETFIELCGPTNSPFTIAPTARMHYAELQIVFDHLFYCLFSKKVFFCTQLLPLFVKSVININVYI